MSFKSYILNNGLQYKNLCSAIFFKFYFFFTWLICDEFHKGNLVQLKSWKQNNYFKTNKLRLKRRKVIKSANIKD